MAPASFRPPAQKFVDIAGMSGHLSLAVEPIRSTTAGENRPIVAVGLRISAENSEVKLIDHVRVRFKTGGTADVRPTPPAGRSLFGL